VNGKNKNFPAIVKGGGKKGTAQHQLGRCFTRGREKPSRRRGKNRKKKNEKRHPQPTRKAILRFSQGRGRKNSILTETGVAPINHFKVDQEKGAIDCGKVA